PTVSLSGHRVAAMRRRRSSSAACGTWILKARLDGSSAGARPVDAWAKTKLSVPEAVVVCPWPGKERTRRPRASAAAVTAGRLRDAGIDAAVVRRVRLPFTEVMGVPCQGERE